MRCRSLTLMLCWTRCSSSFLVFLSKCGRVPRRPVLPCTVAGLSLSRKCSKWKRSAVRVKTALQSLLDTMILKMNAHETGSAIVKGKVIGGNVPLEKLGTGTGEFEQRTFDRRLPLCILLQRAWLRVAHDGRVWVTCRSLSHSC